MSAKYDIIIIGTECQKYHYVGSRTFYIKRILNKYLPHLNIAIYDMCADDEDRVELSANNFIFLPWIESIDANWCSCFISLENVGKKFLYTDNFYWYEEQKKRLLQEGFNLENLFSIIAFSSRESNSWWNKRAYRYWGIGIDNEYFENLEITKNKKVKIFVDDYWDLDICPEPYNAINTLDNCFPKIKEKYGDKIEIISQIQDRDWVDSKIDKEIDLESIIHHYNDCNAYVVSHNENCGMAQFESLLCGTKIVTNKNFSNQSSLLAGNHSHELWENEDEFITAIENCFEYDKSLVKKISLESYNSERYFKNIEKDLWKIN